ncbi:MAG: thiamine pyrophosphate-requiring protein [Planctomycetota bacterium]
MAGNASDFLVRRLVDWGVYRVFGYPGDGINGIMGALQRADGDIQFVQARHEELAAFMACAHAKFTGQVGVCMGTSGPGAIHLLNGLYDAKKDHMPVVAIVGQVSTLSIGAEFQQEVDLTALFKDVASACLGFVTNAASIRHCIDRAFRIAKAERTVTCVIVPSDIQEQNAVESPPRKHGANFSGVGYSAPRVVPREGDLRAAASILNSGRKVAMLVGAGALHASEEVREVAEMLGAGVAKALLGKAVLPDDLPYVTGTIGLLGTRPSWEMMMACDTLLMVGTSFPYGEFLPKEGQARGIQIDIKAGVLGLRYPTEVNLHGESKLTLRTLLPMLEAKVDHTWREWIEGRVAEWWQVLEARAANTADPVNPQLVFWEASPRLPDRCIITADSGSAASWYARDIRIRRGMMASLSGGLATMCPGVPYAAAAKFAYPDRPVVAFVGDGAMQMLGNNAMITIAEHWHAWRDPRLVVCVLNNRDLNQVTWEQRVFSGDPKYPASQNLPAFDFAGYAELLGLRGLRVERPDDVGGAWDSAFNSDRPVVIDAHTDPNVPPLPPHITYEQARAYMSSIVKGDPDAYGMVKQTFKDMVASWMPQR